MSLRSPYGDYTDAVGLRNSHDKSFPIGIAFGSRVFVCDNLAFIGDQVIRRKHTVKAKREFAPILLRERSFLELILSNVEAHTFIQAAAGD